MDSFRLPRAAPPLLIAAVVAALIIPSLRGSAEAADPDEVMPPEGARLSDAEIVALRTWIDRGAVWKDPEPYPLALAKVVVPPGPGNPLDRLLADYWRRQGIAAPPVVSDEVFARRTAFDLVGRPLPADDLVAFLADEAADKRARLVDALLADEEGFVDHCERTPPP